MARFHLHVRDDLVAPDSEGLELPHLEAAKTAALQGARELIAENIRCGKPVHKSHRVEIADEAGQVLHTISFGEIVDLRP